MRSAKDKESTLLMLDSETEDSWTSYRVILRARYMYYYISNRKKQVRRSFVLYLPSSLFYLLYLSQHDYRVIPLKYSTVSWREKAEEDGSWVFMVVTPIVTYTLKAKHQVAMVRDKGKQQTIPLMLVCIGRMGSHWEKQKQPGQKESRQTIKLYLPPSLHAGILRD